MAAPSITPLAEGDALDGPNMAAIATALNNLDIADLAMGALNENHLPDLSFDTLFANGYNATSPYTLGSIDPDYGSGGTRDNYRTCFDTTTVVDFQTFSTDTTSGRTAPYGPPAANDNGWAILAFNRNTAYAAEVSLASAVDLATAGQPTHLLCRGNIGLYTQAGTGHASPFNILCVAVGWADGSGNRFVDEQSIRFIQADQYSTTVPVMSVIDAAKIAAVSGDNDLESVFLVVCESNRASTTATPDGTYIDFYSLTVTPILAGSL